METITRWADRSMRHQYVPLRYFNVAGAKPDGSIGEDHGPHCASSYKWPKANVKISILGMTTRHQMGPMFGTMSIIEATRCHLAVELLSERNRSTALT